MSTINTEKIRVVPYTAEQKVLWDTFVANANNGTVFHLQSFLEYHKPDTFRFYHLLFYQGDKLLAVLPGGLKKDFHDRDVFWSPVGASYGGFVTQDISFEQALRLIDTLIAYGKVQAWSGMYIIPPPILYSTVLSQNLEYAMLYRKFGYEFHYISHAIDLQHGAKSVFDLYDKSTRKTVRKILRENKLSIVKSDNYSMFYPILLDNKNRHNTKPTHSLDDLHRLAELVPEHVKLLLVYYEGKAIAGSYLMICNQQVVLCFYNMLLYEYQHLKPVYLMMHSIIEWARDNGYRWVDIGVSQVPTALDPMTPAISLIEFKERFLARGFLRSTFYYAFV